MRLIAVLASFLVVSLSAGVARAQPFSFPRSAPEAQGISSQAILDFVEQAEQTIDALHSVMIVRHGTVVAEGWWSPYAADEPHMMFSLSKSFTSTAVGLAAAEGKLGLDDTVLSFFPEQAPAERSANLEAMRVRDLLTMTAGHHQEAIQNFPYRSEDDLVAKFLALPVAHKPGTFFVYNTPASYMLSAIVQKVTGQTVLDYLGPRLFAPLGIADPAWEASRQGVSMGGFGLSIRTEDIARFGQLYLQRGLWHGRQLVPAAWVDEATARQTSNGSSPASDWEQGYGYQFWRSRHGFYRGDGAHGQFCLVLPQHDTVIAITSGTRDMGSVMNLVWDRLVPALGGAPLPPDQAAQRALTARLATLTLPPVRGVRPDATALAAASRRYTFGDNGSSIEWLSVEPAAAHDGQTIALRIGGVEQRVSARAGVWEKGVWAEAPRAGTPSVITAVDQGRGEPMAASGAWSAGDTYVLKIARYRTPFVTTYRLRFSGDALAVEIEQNVGPADQRVTRLTGSAGAPPSGGPDPAAPAAGF